MAKRGRREHPSAHRCTSNLNSDAPGGEHGDHGEQDGFGDLDRPLVTARAATAVLVEVSRHLGVDVGLGHPSFRVDLAGLLLSSGVPPVKRWSPSCLGPAAVTLDLDWPPRHRAVTVREERHVPQAPEDPDGPVRLPRSRGRGIRVVGRVGIEPTTLGSEARSDASLATCHSPRRDSTSMRSGTVQYCLAVLLWLADWFAATSVRGSLESHQHIDLRERLTLSRSRCPASAYPSDSCGSRRRPSSKAFSVDW